MVTSICAVGTYLIFSTLHVLVPKLFLSIRCPYTSYLTCHIFPHIYAPILLIFHPFTKKNQAALVASRLLKRTGRDGLSTLSESSRFRPVWTHSVPSNILAGQRNGTETWWTCSCQCEHIRLNTHEKILLNGDVPRQNWNMTYSVNQPLPVCRIQECS